MTIPVPPTFTSGPVYAPQLRASVSDAVALLSRPPVLISQQTTSAQSIPWNTWTAMEMDTDTHDNYGGHLVTSPASPYYYGMLPGWYLCQASAPMDPTVTGFTVLSAGIGGVQAGGSNTQYGGACIPAQNGNVNGWQSAACKLMKMVNTGTYGGAGNDYIYGAVYQAAPTNTAQALNNSANGPPYLTCRWVCALSGTQPLAVPANPAWPVPPSYVTSAFANTNIRNAIEFLIYPPIMEYASNAGASLASASTLPATGTAVTLGTQIADNYSAYSGSTWTAPVAGRYFCYGCVVVSSGAHAVACAAGLTVTSANYNSGTTFTIWGGAGTANVSAASGQVVRKVLRLNAGDTIQLAASQYDSTGASVSYSTGISQPRMLTVWCGA